MTTAMPRTPRGNRHATRAPLDLFDQAGDAAWVKGIGTGQRYAYRVDGPYKSSEGHRFNFNRRLLDPFVTAISRLPAWDLASARGTGAVE
jgi:glycogen operon protein